MDIAPWISTKQLLRNPAKYYDKLLYLGTDYTLVTDSGRMVEVNMLPFHLFSDLNVLNHGKIGDVIYVIIKAESIEHFQNINKKFRNAGMTDKPITMDDRGFVDLITYHVTVIMPDEIQQIIQTMPC